MAESVNEVVESEADCSALRSVFSPCLLQFHSHIPYFYFLGTSKVTKAVGHGSHSPAPLDLCPCSLFMKRAAGFSVIPLMQREVCGPARDDTDLSYFLLKAGKDHK